MKKKILGFCLILFFFNLLTAEVDSDLLPLGKSKLKFKIGKIEKGQIVNNRNNKTVKLADIIRQNLKTDVFVIGEQHNSYECHVFQKNFIEQLYRQHKNIIVGFEFFSQKDNQILEQWCQGNISEKELLAKTGWYKKTGLNYGYTRIIMDVIKKYKIKVIGLNIPRQIVRNVSRKGFKTLPQEHKKLFPTINFYNPDHEFFIKSIFGQMAVNVPFWFKGVYDAQKCWDIIMAESMKNTLKKKIYRKYKGVIIAGSNHVAYGLGIPYRYQKAKRKVKITTIVPVSLPPAEDGKEETEDNPMLKMLKKNWEPSSLFSRGIADYVFAVPGDEKAYFPYFGLAGNFKENHIEVKRVAKTGIAKEYGIDKGDKILKIDGINITSMEQFRTLLALKNWDDALELQLIKKIKLARDNKDQDKKTD